MRLPLTLFMLALMVSLKTFPQAQTRRLPSIINHPSLSVYAPYVSADGNALLFLANNGQDGALTLNYTWRENDWAQPVEVPKHLITRLNFMWGYALSGDGKKMYFTSAKTPVIGGYDIFVSELKGSVWSQPENLTAPVNSRANEGSPSLSADGNTLYFMRCGKMDANKADDCKLFRSKKKSNGQWEEPSDLPSHINTGNSQAPRIMADGETLIFSSNKMRGGKGGMDLYMTRLVNGSWTNPVPLDFVNTDKDDQYVSASALGRYLLKEAPGSKKNTEIVEFLFPADLRPKGLMKVEGKITDADGNLINAYVSIVDLNTTKRVYNGRPAADGSFSTYLQEGTMYELVVDAEESNLSYFSKVFDLTSDRIPQKEMVSVTLKTPEAKDEFSLDAIRFKPHSAELERSSEEQLKRLTRLIKANPSKIFEIQVLLYGYEESSEAAHDDLTEVINDSIRTIVNDRDTVIAKTIYHNNRTVQQAQAVVHYLTASGIEEKRLRYFGNAVHATTPEEKKLTVKAVVRDK